MPEAGGRRSEVRGQSGGGARRPASGINGASQRRRPGGAKGQSHRSRIRRAYARPTEAKLKTTRDELSCDMEMLIFSKCPPTRAEDGRLCRFPQDAIDAWATCGVTHRPPNPGGQVLEALGRWEKPGKGKTIRELLGGANDSTGQTGLSLRLHGDFKKVELITAAGDFCRSSQIGGDTAIIVASSKECRHGKDRKAAWHRFMTQRCNSASLFRGDSP